jgi:hypothetical protein
MPKILVPLLVTVALVPAALVGAGCGGDDSSSSSTKSDPASPPATSVSKDGVPNDAGELRKACIRDARKMGESEDQATRNCTAPSAESIRKAANAAVRSCLEGASQIPAGSERTQAIQECKDTVR